jgi:hypothetical protein
MQRIFDPYTGVRVSAAHIATDGAGAWAEYGPLFNGMTWSNERCSVLPAICNALRGDPSLCTAARLPRHRCQHPPADLLPPPDSTRTSLSPDSHSPSTRATPHPHRFAARGGPRHGTETVGPDEVSQLCGTDAVVSVLRLRPGASILPHTGRY